MSKKRTRKKRQHRGQKKRSTTIINSSGRYVGVFSKDTTISSCWGCGFHRVVPRELSNRDDIQLDDDTRARIKAKADALEKVVALDPQVIAARKRLEVEHANARTEYEKTKAETLNSERFRDAVRVAEEESKLAELKQEQAKSLSDRLIEAWKRSRVETPDTDDE